MAQLYNAGEIKTRPGVFYRYSNRGGNAPEGAMDGVNAIVIGASWGPTGTVTVHETANSIIETYGNVEAALMLKTAGARKIYIYRPEGTGGAAGSVTVGGGSIKAKYAGARALGVKIQVKAGDATTKQCIVLDGTTQLEKFEFAAGDSKEGDALKAVLANSKYIVYEATTSEVVAEGEYKLDGGKNPTLTPQDYLKGFQALEPHRYNVLTTDSIDESVVAILKSYVASVEEYGKLILGVIGGTTAEDFDARLAKAKACNDKKIIYLGNAYINSAGETVEGVLAINYAAGVISSTPSNQSIVHSAVYDAVDVPEKLTNSQYVEAIKNGMLLFSIGPDGQVWFDSGVNTLTTPAENEDDGWKKIKRTKVRFELMDRIDRVVAPLVGKIDCDNDGVAAVIQAGMGVITSMIAEKKLMTGATMIEDPDNPRTSDSAWFLIQADDIDTMEKIYLHYQFRYSQNA